MNHVPNFHWGHGVDIKVKAIGMGREGGREGGREIGMGGQGVAGAMLGGAWNTLGQVGHLFFCCCNY